MKIETIAIHSGQTSDPSTGAISPPIHLSTTFERDIGGDYNRGFKYIRDGNPNRNMLEKCLTEIEAGEFTVTFASGMAAATAILQALNPGDHVIFPDDIYFGVRELHRGIFTRWGLKATVVNMTNVDNVKNAIQTSTKLIWIETPSNPLLKLVNLHDIVELARASNLLTCCDNTWCTPVIQRPLDIGVDLALHSSTKYFGGHSDVMGGAVVFKRSSTIYERIRQIQKESGNVPSPFDSWLIHRGIQTLYYRMRAQSEHALKIAQFLDNHVEVEQVFYPGLENHLGYEVAKKQMKWFGGMLSFCVHGDRQRTMNISEKLRIIKRATSLGGCHSLIEHRASVEGADTMAPENLLRLSVGLENPVDLIEDLGQALG